MRLTSSLFRRRALLAAPLATIGPSTPKPRLLACGWCYEEHGEAVHPHPECPIGYTDPDTALALSELQGQLARTQSACLRLAQQLEARYVRYSWTEQLAQELRAIAHDTGPSGRS